MKQEKGSSTPQSCPVSPGLAEHRARVYRILSLAHAQSPDHALVEALRSWAELGGEFQAGDLPPLMRRGLERIRQWTKCHGYPSPAQAVDVLACEFQRLFRGLSPRHSPMPPYESVYRDGGTVYGPSTGLVSQTYRRFHLEGKNGEPPDHIAMELDFMRFLCEKESLARRQNHRLAEESCMALPGLLEEQEAFMDNHLAAWAPVFCDSLRSFDTSGFYQAIADLTEGWIQLDREVVRSLIELEHGP